MTKTGISVGSVRHPVKIGARWLGILTVAISISQTPSAQAPATASSVRVDHATAIVFSEGEPQLIEAPGGLQREQSTTPSGALDIAPEEPASLAAAALGIDSSDREAVVDAYRWDYMWVVDDAPGASPGTFDWTGSVEGCNPGTISAIAFERTEAAVNFFRSMAGLRPVVFEPAWSAQLQATALIMAANWSLSHNPDSSWACWTESGAEGASVSNISLGRTAPRTAIEAYMRDSGETNTPVGHRRWILSPGAEFFGFGATRGANALRVIPSHSAPQGTPKWIAYPGGGYWPAELSTTRWSLSYGNGYADFSNASVSVTHEGDPVEIIVYTDSSFYGRMSTIVWDIIDTRWSDIVSGTDDQRFDVAVTGIKVGDAMVDYSYATTMVDAVPPAPWDARESKFLRDIIYLQWKGITKGCNPPDNTMFCPDAILTRGQMAAFLVRTLDLTDRLDNPFSDDDGSIFEADIERLAAAGITKGCNPPTNDRFCPDSKVTRAQMAAFLVRALGYTDDGGGDLFTDDDASIFEADIDRLGMAGVTLGCNPPANDRFCPTANVTRGQMAAFLHRATG